MAKRTRFYYGGHLRQGRVKGLKTGKYGELLIIMDEEWNEREGHLPKPSLKTYSGHLIQGAHIVDTETNQEVTE